MHALRELQDMFIAPMTGAPMGVIFIFLFSHPDVDLQSGFGICLTFFGSAVALDRLITWRFLACNRLACGGRLVVLFAGDPAAGAPMSTWRSRRASNHQENTVSLLAAIQDMSGPLFPGQPQAVFRAGMP